MAGVPSRREATEQMEHRSGQEWPADPVHGDQDAGQPASAQPETGEPEMNAAGADLTGGEQLTGAELTGGEQLTGAEPTGVELAGGELAGKGVVPSWLAAVSRPVPATGEPRVDAALRLLERLPGLPVSEHSELFEEVHAQLSEVLGELDSGPVGSDAAGR
jgi:hypothetical protein